MLPLLQRRSKRKGACDEHGDGRLVSVPLYSQEERALFEAHPLALQTMGHIEAMRNAGQAVGLVQNIDAHGPLCARLVLALCQSSLQRFMTLLVLEQELADLAWTC